MQIDLHMQLNNMVVQAFPLHKVIRGGMTKKNNASVICGVSLTMCSHPVHSLLTKYELSEFFCPLQQLSYFSVA